MRMVVLITFFLGAVFTRAHSELATEIKITGMESTALRIFPNAKVSLVSPEASGYSVVLLADAGDPSVFAYVYIDPTQGGDGAKALLSAFLTAKSTGALMDVVYESKGTCPTRNFYNTKVIPSYRRVNTAWLY